MYHMYVVYLSQAVFIIFGIQKASDDCSAPPRLVLSLQLTQCSG